MLYNLFPGTWKALLSTAHLESYGGEHFWRSNLAWKPCGAMSLSPGRPRIIVAVGKKQRWKASVR